MVAWNRGPFDIGVTAEALVRGFTSMSRSPGDSTFSSEVPLRLLGGIRDLANFGLASEMGETQQAIFRLPTDLGLSGAAPARVFMAGRAPFDVSMSAETLVRGFTSMSRSPGDPTLSSEVPERILAGIRGLGDAGLASETWAAQQGISRLAADLGLAAVVPERLMMAGRAPFDIGMTAEALVRGFTSMSRSPGDPTLSGEVPVRILAGIRGLGDAGVSTELVARGLAAMRDGVDTVPLVAAVARGVAMVRVLGDDANVWEGADRLVAFARVNADGTVSAVIVSAIYQNQHSHVVTITELTLSGESPARLLAGLRTLSDDGPLGEVATRLAMFGRSAADMPAHGESAMRAVWMLRTPAAGLTLSGESAARLLSGLRMPSESGLEGEQLSRQSILGREVVDTPLQGETAARTAAIWRAAAGAVALDASLNRSLGLMRGAFDIGLSVESPFRSMGYLRLAGDGTLAEGVMRGAGTARAVAYSLPLGESMLSTLAPFTWRVLPGHALVLGARQTSFLVFQVGQTFFLLPRIVDFQVH